MKAKAVCTEKGEATCCTARPAENKKQIAVKRGNGWDSWEHRRITAENCKALVQRNLTDEEAGSVLDQLYCLASVMSDVLIEQHESAPPSEHPLVRSSTETSPFPDSGLAENVASTDIL